MDGQIDRTDNWMHRMDGLPACLQTDGWVGGQTDGQMDGWVRIGYTDGQMKEEKEKEGFAIVSMDYQGMVVIVKSGKWNRCACVCRHVYVLHPSKDKTREELNKLFHTDDVISMRLLCIEFDSELLFAAACSIWLRSMTCLKYVIDPSLFPH
jgi:hypothetical protein